MGFRFIKIIAILLLYTSIVSSGENDLSNNLAVMPFKSISVKEGDTEIINNCVRSAFVNTGNFLVVAQDKIPVILKQQQLQCSDITDRDCAVQAGHISNIRWMVVGSVGKLGSTMFLNAETIDVQTGQIVKSVNLTEKEIAAFVFNISDIVNALNPLVPQPKPDQPEPTDYFLKNDYEKVSVGELAPWGFKINRFNVPHIVKPGQKITMDTSWLYTKETGYYNPNAVIFVSVYGDWQPDVPIRHLVHGELQGPPRLISKSTEFIAPDKPGVYHIRWSIVWAFAPVKSFYGTDPDGQYNPGIGPWAEIEFTVVSG